MTGKIFLISKKKNTHRSPSLELLTSGSEKQLIRRDFGHRYIQYAQHTDIQQVDKDFTLKPLLGQHFNDSILEIIFI